MLCFRPNLLLTTVTIATRQLMPQDHILSFGFAFSLWEHLDSDCPFLPSIPSSSLHRPQGGRRGTPSRRQSMPGARPTVTRLTIRAAKIYHLAPCHFSRQLPGRIGKERGHEGLVGPTAATTDQPFLCPDHCMPSPLCGARCSGFIDPL